MWCGRVGMAVSDVQLNIVLADEENVLAGGNPDPNNNAALPRASSVKKCLFGASDPEDTARMLREQFASDRQRFMLRFGVDISNLENNATAAAAASSTSEKGSQKMKKGGVLKAKTDKFSNRVLKPYNKQSKITDFCQVKKRSYNTKKDSKQ